MDAESFVLILILVIAMIPFAFVGLFQDPEETARRIAEVEKLNGGITNGRTLRHHSQVSQCIGYQEA